MRGNRRPVTVNATSSVSDLPRLAIVATHPIQYLTPVFRQLHERHTVDIQVFYEWKGTAQQASHDHGFGQSIQWDIPLLDGYPHVFIQNQATDPGTHHFWGLHNPTLVPSVLAWKPDVVFLFGWCFRSHVSLLRALRNRVPILFRGDSTLLDERLGIKKISRRLGLRWIYGHVAKALYVGQNNRRYFAAHGLKEEQLIWAPHAVDNERFADPSGQRQHEAILWRQQLGISSSDTVFLFAGKLEPKKDPHIVLRAFQRLHAHDTHLVYVGSGPLASSLRESAGERVHFVGFQNQSRMPVAYRLGNVLVLPSRYDETWGLAVNEAMACGRPAIVSDRVGCAVDLIVEGETGYTFPYGDVEALHTLFNQIYEHRSKCTQMGEEAQELIARWSIDKQVDVIEKTVRSMASSF